MSSNDLLMGLIHKKHRHSSQLHQEYDDYPVISGYGSHKLLGKNLFKVDKSLHVKRVDKPHEFAKKKIESSVNNFLIAKSLNIGYYLITPLLLGVFFGIGLDLFFKTKPLFFLLLFALGIAGSFYNLWKIVTETK